MYGFIKKVQLPLVLSKINEIGFQNDRSEWESSED